MSAVASAAAEGSSCLPAKVSSAGTDREQRRIAWAAFLDGLEESAVVYDDLARRPSAFDEVIGRDLDRTLPREELFRDKGGRGQSALFRVLRALSTHLWDIGYTQSLNFVVATLINVFPDDEALVFRCARTLLFKYSLADFYRPRFPKLGVTVWQFDKVVEQFLPRVHNTLQAHGITAEYYAMSWFLTLYSSDLPQHVVVQIWDRFMVDGWQVIVQVGLALLQDIADEIEALDSCELLVFLKKFFRKRRYDAEAILGIASRFEVNHRMLSDLEVAYAHGKGVAAVDDLCIEGDASAAERGLGVATEPDQGNTMLPFLVHNLDTGETFLLEDEWTNYAEESQRSSPGAIKKPFQAAGPRPCAQVIQRANSDLRLAGQFWTRGVQQEALRALGKT